MTGFNDRIHLKGKAEEDQYFARLDRDRIAALHSKNIHAKNIHEKNIQTKNSEKHSPDAMRPVAGDPDKLANRSAATGS